MSGSHRLEFGDCAGKYCAASGAVSRDHVRLNDIFERAREGDSLALAIIERASKALALSISHMVMLFNPAMIILGGDLLQGEDLLAPRIQRELAAQLPDFTETTELTVTGLGLDIGLKGAAFLAFQNAVNNPS